MKVQKAKGNEISNHVDNLQYLKSKVFGCIGITTEEEGRDLDVYFHFSKLGNESLAKNDLAKYLKDARLKNPNINFFTQYEDKKTQISSAP